MDIGFIILSPDHNKAGLKNTLGSIKHHSYNRESICIVGNNATATDIKDMKELCPIYKGKDTITSLVNTGMKKLKNDWGFIVFAGSRLPLFIEKSWASFCKAESDVLFPIAENKCEFVEGSFNGVLINTKFFKKVGDFPIEVMQKEGLNDFEFAKLLWASDALQHGVTFKGILGMRVI